MLLQQASKPLLPSISLTILWLGALGGGWLLAAFALPWYGWLGVSGLVIYLVQVERDGIALANFGLVVTMSLITLQKTWPAGLGGTLPQSNARLWAASLIALWLGAMIWFYLLSLGRSQTQQILRHLDLPLRYAPSLVTLFTLSAGVLGWLVHGFMPYLNVIALGAANLMP